MKTRFIKIKNNILNEIHEVLKNIAPYFVIMTVITGLILYATCAKADAKSEEATRIYQSVSESLIEKKKPIETEFDSMMRIFEHNVKLEMLSLTLGSPVGVIGVPMLYLQMPIYVDVINVAYDIYKETRIQNNKDYSSLAEFLLSGIAPHGIIEIPVIIFVYAVMLMLYVKIVGILSLINKNNIKETFLNMSKTYLNTVVATTVIIVPLLAVAAFIEAYITPLIMSKVII